MRCSFCGNDTLLIGTLHWYTTFRYEDRDYIFKIEKGKKRKKPVFEILKYCPACLRKYCIGRKEEEE